MRGRVFIVEDHPELVRSYRVLLSLWDGIEICGTAVSAEEALDSELLDLAELVMLDISLPGMDGITLLRHLRARAFSGHLVVVSGHAEDQYASAALGAGADAFVDKSRPEVLIDVLERFLGGGTPVPVG